MPKGDMRANLIITVFPQKLVPNAHTLGPFLKWGAKECPNKPWPDDSNLPSKATHNHKIAVRFPKVWTIKYMSLEPRLPAGGV